MSAPGPTTRQAAARSTNRHLAFGVLAAPVAWATNEIVNVALVGRSCNAGSDAPSLVATLSMITVLAAVVAAAGAWIALRIFRRDTPGQVAVAEGWGRVEFVAKLGFLLSSLLFFNIVLFGLVPWLLGPC